ncbi:MAG: hypothetical protein IPK71_26995 [Myxococcales bacterium]|jgi:methyl-accepting chemotaxis protein|nr:hypothetical protein [Myxococcales bacterium]MBL9108544.1 hypothetical protein [Myxococcales bacterium]
MSNAEAAAAPRPKYKRSVKNYIVDSRFQLKYTSFIVIVAVAIAAPLGVFLFRTSEKVVAESQKVVEESKKVSEVVSLQISKDPVYGSDPELAKAFGAESSSAADKVKAQQEALVAEQRTMMRALVGALGLMVVLIGLLGIYFTHKVAGPIYKMKMLLRQVGEGKLTFYGKLRKGDELQDFFETFATMVERIKERQKREVDELESAIEAARASGASEEAIAKIGHVRDEMKRALEA